MLEDIIALLKIIAGVAILIAIADYWFRQGPPPRGRGRWRDVLRPPQGV